MKAETLELFPNFARTMQKVTNMKGFQLMSLQEVPAQDIYASYVKHVNTINGFKDTMASTTIIDEVAKLVPTGETLQVTRECVTDINLKWNDWVRCYTTLCGNYNLVSDDAEDVAESLGKSIEKLGILCDDPNDEDAQKDLRKAVIRIGTKLEDAVKKNG